MKLLLKIYFLMFLFSTYDYDDKLYKSILMRQMQLFFMTIFCKGLSINKCLHNFQRSKEFRIKMVKD